MPWLLKWWRNRADGAWFPPGSDVSWQDGWTLHNGLKWAGEDLADSDLVGWHMTAGDLRLDLILRSHERRSVRFPHVAKIEMRGTLEHSRTALGWEVLEAKTLVADRGRTDGRSVHVLNLATALVTFASGQGVCDDSKESLS